MVRKKFLIPILAVALTIPTLTACGGNDSSLQSEVQSVSDSKEEVEPIGSESDADSSKDTDTSKTVTVDEKTGEYTVSDNAYDSEWILENCKDVGLDNPEFIDENGYYKTEEEKKEVEDALSSLVNEFGKTVFTMDENTENYTDKLYAMLSEDADKDDTDLQQIPQYYSVMANSNVTSTYLKADIRQFYVYTDVEGLDREIRVAGFLDATINDDQTGNENKDVANYFELHFLQKDGKWGISGTYLRDRYAMEKVKFIHDPKQPEDNTYYISMVGWYRGVWDFSSDAEYTIDEIEVVGSDDADSNALNK